MATHRSKTGAVKEGETDYQPKHSAGPKTRKEKLVEWAGTGKAGKK